MVMRLGLVGAFVLILGVGVLLVTSHPGFAIRVGNYAYFLLVISVVFGLVKNEK